MLINGGMWQIGTEQGSGSLAGSITTFSHFLQWFGPQLWETLNLSSLFCLTWFFFSFFSVERLFVMALDHTECSFYGFLSDCTFFSLSETCLLCFPRPVNPDHGRSFCQIVQCMALKGWENILVFLRLRFEVIKSLSGLNGELCKHERHSVARLTSGFK